MEDFIKVAVIGSFILSILLIGARACFAVSGADAECSYDKATTFAKENDIKYKNISCDSDGNCTINTGEKFIALSCPVMLQRGECTVKVKNLNLE